MKFWVRMLGLLLLACVAGCATPGTESTGPAIPHPPAHSGLHPFILGADVSWVPEDEAAGATYYDNGVKTDLFEILERHGFNTIRLRVFVNPKSAIGYSHDMKEAFGDLDHLLAEARRVKAHHMNLLVDMMYCDSWASPEDAPKPAAWENLTGDALVQAVREHTRKVMTALQKQDTLPEYAQIGNEITHGMLWPDGRIVSKISSGNAQTDANMAKAGLEGLGHYDMLARLINAGVEEVHAVNPRTQIVLHNSLGRLWPRVEEWMDNLLARNVKFDVIGLSCYSQSTDGDWKNTFAQITKKYQDKNFMVLEYSARKRDINDLVFASPQYRGLGTFIWEPTRHREALFDQHGVNTGGGQPSNFISPATTNPGAATNPANAPFNKGGRYDANDFIKLYDQMSKDYNW